MKKTKHPLYAVYGSLKKGYGNHRLINNDNCEFLGTTLTEPKFSLYSLGAFPGLKENGETAVEIEVYEVKTKEQEARLDGLEGYMGEGNPHNFYNKIVIPTEFGDAFIYTFNGKLRQENFIENGKW